MDIKFKQYLLNESKEFFATQAGDVLEALQEIQQNIKGMGTRQLVKKAEGVVNRIRRILHTSWGVDTRENLEILQRVACAIKKGIEEKDDIQNILSNGTKEIQDMLADLGVPINKIGQEVEKPDTPDQTAPPQSKPSGSQPNLNG